MSRPFVPGGGTVPGCSALPMPLGDPATLRSRAAGLLAIESTASHTPFMRGAMAARLPQVWTGAAAEAAVAESVELVSRARRVLAALPDASAALLRYAAALEQARLEVARLQRQWDDETVAHTQAVATTRSQAVVDVAADHAVALLGDDHEAVKSRLSRQHAEVLSRLRTSAVTAARTVEAASDRTFPSRGEPNGPALRDRLYAGMAFAGGAAAASQSRQLALGDAATLKRLLAQASSAQPTSSPQALSQVLVAVQGRVDDPVYAQVMVEQIGVGGTQSLVAQLARSRSGIGREQLQSVTGLLGRLLLTATKPGYRRARPAHRTARQLGLVAVA